MNRFSYARPGSVADAVRELAGHPAAKVIAGGTNLVDLMKYNVERPTHLVDVGRLPGLKEIEEAGEGLRIGALVSNTAAAYDERVKERYPLLSSAILAGASPQLRNAATTGGNLLQRTRCYYFYDPATPCNKREPGSGCPAKNGQNRILAILGTSEHCIATHPSDMCVALAALEAVVKVVGPNGERSIPMADFHRLPGNMPEKDTNLHADEIILGVELPEPRFAKHYTYLKLRDRLSYAFALVSVAAALEMDGDTIGEARIALGGVAHKPWRVEEAEMMLRGKTADRRVFAAVAERILEGAQGFGHNDFKVDLARRAVIRALSQAARGTPQSQTDKRIQ
ncbi:FAD binding domain-containing protein [Pararoseomonas indoligenes]|uniref:Xanthine dehydrogenase family protein subunit M n=1 Tax=Roseomonas indoligenes TaxID=2820811 RepID=A0A940N5J6_9PROT|nr:xanthine dehydrogenase family protein subunit M [Pararoseomonas indoligenes]